MSGDVVKYESLAAVASMSARIELKAWSDRMSEIESAPKNRRVEVMKAMAARGDASFGTIRRRYYAYQKHGLAALVDRRSEKSYSMNSLPHNLSYLYTRRFSSRNNPSS